MELKIILNIDKIVLNGLGSVNTVHLERAIHGELVRLISTEGLPERMRHKGFDLGSIDGGKMNIPATFNSRSIGKGIARSIYNSIGMK